MFKRFDKKSEYPVIHKLAKLIAAIVNTVLFTIILDIDHYILFGIINFTYFFGVNSIAYSIETIFNVRHRHDKL